MRFAKGVNITWLYKIQALSYFFIYSFFTFFSAIFNLSYYYFGENSRIFHERKRQKGRGIYEMWITKAYPWHFLSIAYNIKMVHFLIYKDIGYIPNHSLFNHFLDRKSNNNKINEQKNEGKHLEENYWKNFVHRRFFYLSFIRTKKK